LVPFTVTLTSASVFLYPIRDVDFNSSAAEKLCKVLGKTPKSVGQIAKDSGLSEGTVRVYLGQFDCFENVWGKGYVYTGGGTTVKAAPKGAKKKTSRKTKKAKKTAKKATEAATTA